MPPPASLKGRHDFVASTRRRSTEMVPLLRFRTSPKSQEAKEEIRGIRLREAKDIHERLEETVVLGGQQQCGLSESRSFNLQAEMSTANSFCYAHEGETFAKHRLAWQDDVRNGTGERKRGKRSGYRFRNKREHQA